MYEALQKDGTRISVRENVRSARDEHGEILYYEGFLEDRTRLKTFEEKFQQSERQTFALFEEARTMRDRLGQLSREVLRIQEEERKRISRELHDEVGQALTAMSVNLEMVHRAAARRKDPIIKKKMRDTQTLIEKIFDNIHRFAQELRPAVLDQLGLLPAVQRSAREFSSRTGISVNLDLDHLVEEAATPDQKTTLYRVAQESLTNVAKHAKATRVVIRIHVSSDCVHMSVRDDGVGIEPDEPASPTRNALHLGVLGMQERVHDIGGEFVIESAPGRGTAIIVGLRREFPPRDQEKSSNQ
jgi:signal transduction histidine kinase